MHDQTWTLIVPVYKRPCRTLRWWLPIGWQAREIFMAQPVLLELEAPLKVVGDVHGMPCHTPTPLCNFLKGLSRV